MTKPLLLVAAALAASSSVARAESVEPAPAAAPRGTYVHVDASAGLMRDFRTGIAIEAGRRIGDTPFFAHALVHGGAQTRDGKFVQARVGGDARLCSRKERVCGIAAADVGYQYDHAHTSSPFSGMDEVVKAHDLLLVPRLAVEAGGRLRVRLAVEVPLAARLDERETDYGVDYYAGVGYAF